jgi:ABC-type antimicrobial peptide transport system permease subunit
MRRGTLRWLVGGVVGLLVAGVLALVLLSGTHPPTTASCLAATATHCVRLPNAQLDSTNTPISAIGGLLVGLVLAVAAVLVAGWRQLRRAAGRPSPEAR